MLLQCISRKCGFSRPVFETEIFKDSVYTIFRSVLIFLSCHSVLGSLLFFFFPDLCLNFCYPALNLGAASRASLTSGFHLDVTKGKYQQETRGREPVTLGIYSWAFP